MSTTRQAHDPFAPYPGRRRAQSLPPEPEPAPGLLPAIENPGGGGHPAGAEVAPPGTETAGPGELPAGEEDAAGVQSTPEPSTPASVPQLDTLTRNELVAIAEAMTLPTSGTKAELIARIRARQAG